MKPTLQVVWYKRDLRIDDHAPLAEAARRGPVLPLYIVEPAMISAPDFDARHWTFIRGSLIELRRNLFSLGQPLVVRTGETVAVLDALHREVRFARIWAHEETGNQIAVQRDHEVRAWASDRKVALQELPTNGVVRHLSNRDAWDGIWEERMRQPLVTPPARLKPAAGIEPGPIPDHADLGLPSNQSFAFLHGGEQQGRQMLQSFLTYRGEHYVDAMDSPVMSVTACSRISPYLTWGTLTMRQVVQATRSRTQELRARPAEERTNWMRSLPAFDSRLRRRCQFVQRLEVEPQIEFTNIVRAYDGLRESEFDQTRFEAWASGKTGYPLIDASMRALLETGWVNFRMRAMLASFASFDLWLHWREAGLHLARLLLDYEPGIHWIQHQMQAGTAGIDIVRVYNPTKQAQEHDPEGEFIRRWVPELAQVPTSFIHTPWLLPDAMQRTAGCVIGSDYPVPIVDHIAAAREAQRRIQEVRNRPETRDETQAVEDRKGNRRSAPRPPRDQRTNEPKLTQLSFSSDEWN